MTTKTHHTAELAATLMRASMWNQTDPEFRAAYYLRTSEYHGIVQPYRAANDAITLKRIGEGVARRAMQQCNGIQRYDAKARQVIATWTEQDDARIESQNEKARTKALEILSRYGGEVTLGGDPRGFVMKCTFPMDRLPGRTTPPDEYGIA